MKTRSIYTSITLGVALITLFSSILLGHKFHSKVSQLASEKRSLEMRLDSLDCVNYALESKLDSINKVIPK